MLEELYMQDLANAMKVPAEPLPTGKVTVSGPQVEGAATQPEMGTITGIPQTAFEKALETSGIKLSELGDMIDQSAPGTLNTLLGREVPIIGNLKLRDFLPFVGSKDEGKLTGTPAALIAAGTGQPLRGQPVVGSAIGPDGQRYYGTSGSPAMLSEDVGTAVMDVATLGLGKPLAAGAKKAVKATKNLPVGMSTKAVGQGVDELGFYSAAKQAVDAIQQPKGTGDQFLKQIEKTPGVKPDEIKWTGLDEFLKSKKSVTKAEVQEYLAKNQVEVKEVSLSDSGLKKKFSVNSPEDQDFYDVIDKQGKVVFTGPEDDADYLIDRSLTKFSKYTLPGGENYREVLLTLPSKMLDRDSPEMIKAATEAYGEKSLPRLSDSQWQLISNRLQSTPEFKSQHFDQPNILAHLRVNDRVDADGKKVLFVEEVQSDWHQAGRKKGYDTPQVRENIAKERQKLLDQKDYYAKLAEPYAAQGKDSPREIVDGWTKAANGLQELQSIENSMSKAVPDAPFKGNWHELAMKRVIQMASEGGYDRIAFTTGKTQAERFDLSKQIDELLVTKNPNGTFNLEATMPNGGGTRTVGEEIEADKLDDIVGKDLASMIRKQESKGDVYSADDLRVGGEGMKGFYDDILPKFLNKYAKKWDAKTGQMDMFISPKDGAIPVNYIDVTPKMRESVVTKGQPLFAVGAGGAGAAATQEAEAKPKEKRIKYDANGRRTQQ